MPDFPKVGGATAAEVAAAILVDPADKIEAHNIDGLISTRALDSTVAKAATVALDATVAKEAGNVATVMAKTNLIGASVALESGGNLAGLRTDIPTARAARIDKIQDFLEDSHGTLTGSAVLQTVREFIGTGKLHAYIDLFNMDANDTVVIVQSMKILTAGSYRVYAQETYTGAQTTLPLLHIVMKPGKFGVKIELQQSAHVSFKTFDWQTLVEQAAA